MTKSYKKPIAGYYGVCQRCDFKYKMSELKRDGYGIIACSTCWDPKHPQDTLRKPRPEKYPRFISPEPADKFIANEYPNGVTADDL